jgi:hypothetical protein
MRLSMVLLRLKSHSSLCVRLMRACKWTRHVEREGDLNRVARHFCRILRAAKFLLPGGGGGGGGAKFKKGVSLFLTPL